MLGELRIADKIERTRELVATARQGEADFALVRETGQPCPARRVGPRHGERVTGYSTLFRHVAAAADRLAGVGGKARDALAHRFKRRADVPATRIEHGEADDGKAHQSDSNETEEVAHIRPR